MAANYMVNVPKLKGRENYGEWAFAVENFMILEGLWKCVSTETVADGDENDAKAKAKIILTIDASLYVHIKEAKTTKVLWDKLKSLFDDSGFTRKIGLLRTLISTRLEQCDSMTSYVNQVVETGQKLRGTGFNIDDQWIGSLLLAGLPEKFAPMIMAIEHSGIVISTDSIKTKLLDMETNVGNNGSAFAASKAGNTDWHGNRKTVGNKVKKDLKDVRCYKCKQMGHFKSKCPSQNSVTERQQTNAFSAVFLSGSFSKQDWYVDSGASVHLTADRELLGEVSNETILKEIMVANQAKVPVTCSGEVKMKTVVGKNTYDIVVKNVLCVPGLTTNLLSVSQLVKNGNKVDFKSDCCEIYNKQGELIATANLKDGVYKLNRASSERCLLSVTETADLWHRRLGHINSEYLNKMKNGIVDGLNFQGVADIKKQNCEVCCEGKQSRLPFSKEGTRAKGPLEIIHSDVCGPMEIKSIGGSRYFLTFEDDFSRMAFVYFLQTKDEVFNCFKRFKSLVENQKNCKIKALRTDNGGEFCSGEFENFLSNNGIVHQLTNPYTPEQNGMSERLNRTIVEKAKCLLFESKLEKRFWAEAVNTAVYLRNRSVAAKLNKTPHEIWTGEKPDLGNIRVFGSTVMVHVPKEKRLKWDKKAEKQILVGYGDGVKGYRVYNFEKNSVMTSRDVIIIEDFRDETNIIIKGEEKSSGDPASDIKEISSEDSVSVRSSDEEFFSEIEEHSDSVVDQSDDEFTMEVPVTEEPRKSERRPKPKVFEDYVTYLSSGGSDNLKGDPVTVQEALSRPDGEKWREAIKEELHSFEVNDAWELVDVPKNGTIVQCKWVFKRKFDHENNVKYRARLVAKGFSQKPGIDYFETFSPVVRFSTLRLLFALSIKLGLEITHLDVATAFLNGFLKEKVFMMLPDGFKTSENTKNKVLKMNRAIYGLKQASRAWYERIDLFLCNLGYHKSELEPCLFTKSDGNSITIIALYVDDFFVFSNDSVETEDLKTKLGTNFKIKDLGRVRQCLGMRVNVDKENNIITLDQEQYINQVLTRFNMLDCKPVNCPMESNLKLEKGEVCDMKIPYQQLIGCLMYLAVLTRPDIAYSVSYLSQFNNCYNESHWKQAKRILRYLQRTKNYGLKFYNDGLSLQGFVDADWASDSTDRRSYTGFCFKLCGSAVSWESRKQKTVALSSTEAEYMAISEASKEAMYLKNLILELTGNFSCVPLFNDSQSAQKLCLNPLFHKRTKHIDVRHHFVREAINNNLIEIKYLRTADMPADVLTKSLCLEKHYKFLDLIGVKNLISCASGSVEN